MSDLRPEDQAFFDRFKAWKHRPKDLRPTSENDPTPQAVYADMMKGAHAP